MAFARALNCDAPDGGNACGACPECRKIQHDNHPDVRLYPRCTWEPLAASADSSAGSPVRERANSGKSAKKKRVVTSLRRRKDRDGKKDDKNPLVVHLEDVHEIIHQAGLTAHSGRHKIFVLPVDRDRLGDVGANALLKSIEEPVDGTIFILVASALESVLPTIVSRCQVVPFVQVRGLVIEHHLQANHAADPARARELARVADGRIGWAIRAARDVERDESVPWEARSELDWMLSAEARSELPLDEQAVLLETWLVHARDMIVWSRTERRDWLARPDLTEKWASSRDVDQWFSVVQALEDTRRALLAGGNPRVWWASLGVRMARSV